MASCMLFNLYALLILHKFVRNIMLSTIIILHIVSGTELTSMHAYNSIVFPCNSIPPET